MKIVSPFRFGLFVSVIVLVLVLIGVGVAWKFGWLHTPFSGANKEAVTVTQDGEKTITESLESLDKAEVVMKDDTFVVVRFYGKGVITVEGKSVPVQEAATVFYRDDTKFQGISKEDIQPGDILSLETKKIDTDGSARFEALRITK